MAVADILRLKVGQELVHFLYLGVRTGMRRGVQEYRQRTAVGDTVGAERAIKRAVDLPHRARARVQQAITTYGASVIGNAIVAAVPTTTTAEVNSDLTALETYAQGLVSHRLNDGWTWDQIATDIETNVELEQLRWFFPLPGGYVDVWGE